MPQDSLELECDRLSHVVDSIQYERLRWSRIEGPMLVRLVELAQSAMQGRPDFELIDEGSTSDVKRFVLKVHGNRISGLTFHLDQGQAVITAFPIERSRYRLAAGPPVAAGFDAVDEAWMALALRELLSRVHGQPQA